MKKVIVYLDKDKYEVEVDDSIFEDYKLEACTQLIKRLFEDKNYKITPFIFCEDILADKKTKANVKFGTYNSYKIIINAGYYSMAEKLRMIFYKNNHLDLADEPIQSKFK
jgi:hypothetical protein